jgi:hypothetical protein
MLDQKCDHKSELAQLDTVQQIQVDESANLMMPLGQLFISIRSGTRTTYRISVIATIGLPFASPTDKVDNSTESSQHTVATDLLLVVVARGNSGANLVCRGNDER